MRNRQVSSLLSIGIHAAIAALLFTLGANPGGILQRPKPTEHTTLLAPYHTPLLKEEKNPGGGGGGGGKRAVLPASQGDLPKAAQKQFTPPVVVPLNPEPKLIMEPTIIVAANAPLPMLHIG